MTTNTIPEASQNRRIFNADDISETKIILDLRDQKENYKHSISACGCLFYKHTSKGISLLLIKYKDPNWPNYDDLGGRIDTTDLTIFKAIEREMLEETNGLINMKIKDGRYFYTNKAKYFLVLKEVDENYFVNTSVFGDKELHDNIFRTIEWYDYKEVKNNLAKRLSLNRDLMDYLDNLNF